MDLRLDQAFENSSTEGILTKIPPALWRLDVQQDRQGQDVREYDRCGGVVEVSP